MLESILSSLWSPFTLWVLFGILVARLIKNHFHNGLNKYPSPSTASLTNWWRFFVVLRRKAQLKYLKLHHELGDIVRIGPNALSFADPRAVKAIYGLSNKLPKVG